MDTHRRSALKAVTYRMFATSMVIAIAFLYTGEVGASAKIGMTAAIGKTVLYYLWERLWNHIHWGLQDG